MRSGSLAVVRHPKRLGALAGGSAITLVGPKDGSPGTYIYEFDSWEYGRAEATAPGPVSAIRVVTQRSKSPCSSGSSYGFSGDRIWVSGGCRARVEVDCGATAGGYPDYAAADRNLQTMIQRIQACTLSASAKVPSSWILARPTGNVPASVQAAWDSYSLRLNSELPAARDDAGVFCRAGTNNGGVSYGSPSAGAPYQQGVSAQTQEPVDLYGGDTQSSDIYSAAPLMNTLPEGGGSIVPNPYAPQPAPVAAPRHSRKGVIIGGAAGVLLLGAIAVFALRKKSRRTRSR